MSQSLGNVIREHPQLYATARAVKRQRRKTFERLGSDRYSHPAYEDLDRKLAAYLPGRHGTFVEAGAYDGYWGSNTYWFERFRNWSGVLIEPLPDLAEIARRERPRSQVFQCALVPVDYPHEYASVRFGGTMSVLVGAWNGDEATHAHEGARMEGRETFVVKVPARTLTAVLEEASITEIDLISLDVEGFEAQVLRGLDLSKHAPRFFLIEMLQEAKERRKIETILGPDYEHQAQLSSRDHLYRKVTTPSA